MNILKKIFEIDLLEEILWVMSIFENIYEDFFLTSFDLYVLLIELCVWE